MFSCTPVFEQNLYSTAKININQGGTSSSKTYSLMQLLFYKATVEPKQVITVTGESIPNLKKGAYRDAETIFGNTKALQSYISSWNKTDRIISFHNGSIIEFVSNLDDQSAKNGKRDYLFLNEANGISWPVFFQLAIRTRKTIYIDYNPSASFWCHEKLIGTGPEGNDLSATVRLIISDHRHNVFLSEEEHYKIEGIKDKELWRVYARGLTGNLQGIIFPNWKKISDAEFPNEDGMFAGLDFGYTNDPTAGVICVRVANTIFIKEICYTCALTPSNLNSLFTAHGFTENTPIYCEHDGDMIRQLRMSGLLATAARKGAGSINAGISKINEYTICYTESSKNIDMERKKYMWMIDPDTGKPINTPKPGDDHCFTGETLIKTISGDKPIKDIIENELVLTTNGYKRVLIKWDNGTQQVKDYCLQFDTFCVYLTCTENHLIKTNLGWVQIKDLTPIHKIYLHKNTTGKYTTYIQENDISQRQTNDFMLLCGKQKTIKKFQKGIMCITSMRIPLTTHHATSKLNQPIFTNQNILRRGIKTIQNGQKNFMQKELRQQRNGINQPMVLNGINVHGQSRSAKQWLKNHLIANIVAKSISPKKFQDQSFVTQIARLKHLEQGESYKANVYDLTVEEAHEYYANGVLVHNCMDAIRYAIYTNFYRQE